VKMVYVARKLSTTEERCQDQICFFRRGHYRNKGQYTEKLSWVQFPVKMVFVARKLSVIQERRQDQSCCFSAKIAGTKARTLKTVLGSSPDEDGFCSLETKHKRRTMRRQNLFVSARRLQELRSQTRKLSWVRVQMKMVSAGWKLSTTEWRKQQNCLFWRGECMT
jgi:hypothetical protein